MAKIIDKLQILVFFLTFIKLKKLSIIVIGVVVLFACKKRYNEPVVGELERTAPEEVTYLRATSASTLLELSWTDPTTADLAEIEINYGNQSQRVPKGVEYFALDNSALNTYSFVVKTVDNKGNVSKGVKLVNAIDYRLPYCGKYKFTQYEWFNAAGNTTVYPTTVYDGYVAIDKQSSEQVIVRYRDGSNICTCYNDSVYGGYFKPGLSTSGVLTYTMILQLSNTSLLNGAFPNKDSLAFEFQINSLGNTSGQNVRGKRIQ